MNRTIVIVAIVAVAVGAGYLWMSGSVDETPVKATQVTADMTDAEKAAVEFCMSRGGKVETVIAAEGKTYLCVLADGNKVEVGQYMQANK